MASDIKHPTWVPRVLRPAPRKLTRAREFAQGALGDNLHAASRIPGYLHPDQAALLCYAARHCPDGPIIEIGSFKGKSTVFIARGMKPTNHLYAIDPHIAVVIGSRQDRAAARGHRRRVRL